MVDWTTKTDKDVAMVVLKGRLWCIDECSRLCVCKKEWVGEKRCRWNDCGLLCVREKERERLNGKMKFLLQRRNGVFKVEKAATSSFLSCVHWELCKKDGRPSTVVDIMVRRVWDSRESHVLNKVWAVALLDVEGHWKATQMLLTPSLTKSSKQSLYYFYVAKRWTDDGWMKTANVRFGDVWQMWRPCDVVTWRRCRTTVVFIDDDVAKSKLRLRIVSLVIYLQWARQTQAVTWTVWKNWKHWGRIKSSVSFYITYIQIICSL